jgi:hypothetical protein
MAESKKRREKRKGHRPQRTATWQDESRQQKKKTTKQHSTSSDRREKQQPLGNPVLKPWPHWPRNNNSLATQCSSPGPIGHATTTAWQPSAQALAPLATKQQLLGNPVRKPWPHWPQKGRDKDNDGEEKE